MSNESDEVAQIKDYELVIQELQARLGQLVSSYEVQLAALRVDASRRLEEKDAKIAELHALLAPGPPED